MDSTFRKAPFLDRRDFLRYSATLGAGLMSLEALAACGSTAPAATTASGGTASINSLPPTNEPDAVKEFNATIQAFQKAYPGEKIIAKNDPYDPTTYFAKLAAGQVEDATESYFTEPPLMIQKHAAADITSLAKGWKYFASYDPSIQSIITDPATGKIYGIPADGYALTLWYNRKMFSAAGLDPDKPPTTWDQFRAYAKELKTATVAGYAETSAQNQGGWHFTNWMYTAGGDMQSADGKKALFNSAQGTSVLQLLHDMRFTDQSMTKQQLYTQTDLLQLLATNKVAMVVMAPDEMTSFKFQYQANLDNYGIGPMPQNGGNASLTGGNVFVFNPKSAQNVLKTAVDFVLYSKFDLGALENQYKNANSNGRLVGLPINVIFVGEFRQKLNDLANKYKNVPVQNYQPFASSTLKLRAEPRNQTQKMYAQLDSVMQAVLTNANANPQSLLDQAAQQFQQVLDQSGS
ncbi:extracellular solute-binding protein [Dictyobacter arantiisoli]|uniref:Sugar ABC transporter substrate-binding protein n=1 Tax=Dictyobacter arantiisoli TaxID=2014874 RepID=A0A5A5T6M9_9CHLR|nr:extracellular solute-binding protein [Dictyobacter arantiisoli]GCF07037.1 sugar ABC transporter substrate-binding protein [Dictyobacter arantiisoli]